MLSEHIACPRISFHLYFFSYSESIYSYFSKKIKKKVYIVIKHK